MFVSQASLLAPNHHFILAKMKSANGCCDAQAVVCWEAEHSLPGSVPEEENMQTHCSSVVVFCLNESAQTFL